MIIIKIGDIAEEKVDVIVNAANRELSGGGGVDGAIHKAAGPSVMEECRKIGRCETGSAVMTDAGNLKAKKIIHTVGPIWRDGDSGEPRLLESAYVRSFELARENDLRTIAFPAISTGVYSYPKDEAARIALRVGRRFERDFDEIRYVCFSQKDYEIYESVNNETT